MPAAPELLRALGVLCEPPEPAHERVAEALCLPGRADPADHTELFGFQLVPYASVYLGAEGMLGGEAADRVAGGSRSVASASSVRCSSSAQAAWNGGAEAATARA